MTVPGVWPQARHRWNFDYWAAKHTRGHCTDGRVRQVKLPQKSANTALSSILKCRRGGLHFSRGGRRREARSRWGALFPDSGRNGRDPTEIYGCVWFGRV